MTILGELKGIALTVLSVIVTVVAVPILMIRARKNGTLVYFVSELGDRMIGINKKTGNISVQQALALSGPYLPESLAQIRKHRGREYRMVSTYVLVKGRWYYVFKDDYPWKAPALEVPGRNENFAVRVHVDTGEVIPPMKSH